MIKPAVLDAMVASGCSAEQIAAAVKADQASSTGATRQARYRARKAEQASQSDERDVTSVTVTDMVSPKKETSPTPPKEKTTPSKTEAKASSGCDEKFAEFWLAYPRREGPNPRKPAKLVFDRLIAKGADPDRLIAAAQALAVENPSPTRFIPQSVTWLSQERFGDVEPVISGDTFCPEDNPTTRLHVIRYRNEHDGAEPPRGIQGGKAGYQIPTDWVKSMQMRQAHG